MRSNNMFSSDKQPMPFNKIGWQNESCRPVYNVAVVQICWESRGWWWLAYCRQSAANNKPINMLTDQDCNEWCVTGQRMSHTVIMMTMTCTAVVEQKCSVRAN